MVFKYIIKTEKNILENFDIAINKINNMMVAISLLEESVTYICGRTVNMLIKLVIYIYSIFSFTSFFILFINLADPDHHLIYTSANDLSL